MAQIITLDQYFLLSIFCFFYPCDKGNSMFLPKCLNIVTALCASIKFEKTPHCFPLSQNSKWATTCCQHSCQCTLAYLQYILQVLLIHIAGAKRHSSNKCHAFDAMVDSTLTVKAIAYNLCHIYIHQIIQ